MLRSLFVALSLYSKIPVPGFKWDSDDMKYHLCFFPLIGAVTGLLEYLWYYLFCRFSFENVLFRLIALLIPFFVTGGFHADGFIDTMDALSSWQDKNKKLEILEDPHVGAFAVIRFCMFILTAIAFAFQINNKDAVIAICFSFWLSRCLSAVSVIKFPKAKDKGMISTASKNGEKKIVFIFAVLEFTAAVLSLFFIELKTLQYPFAVLLSCIVSFIFYFNISKRYFGGITGDLAGFFVCICELLSLVACGVCCIISGGI